MAFIDANKTDVVEGRLLGVEPICSVLQVAPSTYYAAKDRAPSARSISDAVLTPALVSLWGDNYRVYGVRKLWKAARRAGIEIGRDQTGRLMRAASIEGAIRSKRVKTTRPDPTSARHPDLELATLGWVHCTTRSACTATSATSRLPSSRKRSMLTKQQPTGCWESNSASLHQTQSGSLRTFAHYRARILLAASGARSTRPNHA